jgi:hypothetical protein
MKAQLPSLAALTILVATASGAPRTSGDYAITAETLDFGGQRVTSADYAIDASLGPVVGVSTDGTAATVAKHGYIGQLYDLLGYGLLASDYYPAELGTTQLFPVRSADDGTNVVIPAMEFTFSVVSGPIASVSGSGLVTASAVYQNTGAVVGATSPAFAGQLELPLNVQDTIADNFGTYAGDALADAWQVQYFGLDNPLAAPGLDPDGDGQTNLFEYTAGLVPTDAASVFRLRIERVPGQPGQKSLVFSPTFGDRTYTVKSKPALGVGTWEPLSSEADDNLFPERTVLDLDASGARKFYQVEITK